MAAVGSEISSLFVLNLQLQQTAALAARCVCESGDFSSQAECYRVSFKVQSVKSRLQ